MSYLGPTIKDGVLRYTSPSAIKKFDASSEGGCERQWGFRYISRLKPETSPAQQRGIDGHARIEHHLKTGETTLTDLERPGLIWIPRERDRIWVEPEITLEHPLYVLAGVPLIGKVDCLDYSGWYIDPQGETHVQEFFEVDDWKYSGDPRKWGKNADWIREDLAMNAYALWGWQRLPGNEARLSHVYFCTRRPDSFKRTAVVDKPHALRVVQAAEPIVERMKTVAATCTDPNDLTPNYDSCDAYSGCPYQARCNRPLEAVVRMSLGMKKSPAPVPVTEENLMSMLEQMTGTQNAAPSDSMDERVAKLERAEQEESAPPPAAPPPANWDAMLREVRSYDIGTPTFGGKAAVEVARVYRWDHQEGQGIAGSKDLAAVNVRTAEDMTNTLRELRERFPDPSKAAAQLAAAKSAAPPPAPPPAPATPPDGVPSALPPGATLPPPTEAADPLPPEHTLDLSDAVKSEVEAHRAQSETAAPPPADSPKPPGRPASDLPAAKFKKIKKSKVVEMLMGLMSKLGIHDVDDIDSYTPTSGGPADVQYYEARIAELKAQIESGVAENKSLRGQVESLSTATSDTGTAETVAKLEAALTESRKREKAWADAYQPLKEECERLRAAGGGSDGPAVELWVNCLPNDLSLKPLDDYVDDIMLKVAQAGSAPHMFAADDKSIIAFNKWRGWLDKVVEQEAPAPGKYYLRAGSDKVNESVANALRKYHGARVHWGVA